MSLIPREVIDKLENAEAQISTLNDKLDRVIVLLEGVIEQLRIGNERQA